MLPPRPRGCDRGPGGDRPLRGGRRAPGGRDTGHHRGGRRSGATRRYGSWCRGLAGIGSVLVQAAARLDEPGYLDLAQRAARTCAALAPRMPLVTQCCGLAGVGELMVDVAEASASEEFWEAAETVALLVLSRSGGTWSRPVFPDTGLTGPSATWADGSAGVLSFFRRLRARGGPRLGLPI
ncbi:lanthionine synthetase LanC family protein [Streptomyces venezuelae ATCC 10712]